MHMFTAWYCFNEDGDLWVTTDETQANAETASGEIGGIVIKIVKVDLEATLPEVEEVSVQEPEGETTDPAAKASQGTVAEAPAEE